MSYHPGAYCGGIRTLNDLRDRCRIDDEIGCWIWAGAAENNCPKVWCLDPDRQKRRVMSGPRSAWVLAGRGSPGKLLVYHSACTNSLCVNPAHLAIGTRAEAGARLREQGHLRGLPHRSAINRRNASGQSKYTPELKAEILASDEPNTHIGERLGIHHNTVSLIRRGQRWAGACNGASVFNYRP